MKKNALYGVAAALLASATAVAAGLPAQKPATAPKSAAALKASLTGTKAPISGLRLNGVKPMSRAQKLAAGYGKLDSTLTTIAQVSQTAPKAQMMGALKAVSPRAHLSLSAPRTVPTVLVEMVANGDPVSVKAQLKALGATKSYHFKNHISAWVPVDQLKAVGGLRGVRSMHASMARTNAGSVVTQGDFVQRSAALRASTLVSGITGAGQTVGVLSDSFDCGFQVDTYADNVLSGDLPPDVTVLAEEEGCGSGTDEGRAMAQLVYDVAPGSRLKFYSAFNGEAAFANGFLELLDAGATVIVDDVTYFDEPYFQDGIIAQAVDIAAQSGVQVFSSAGNQARQSYEAAPGESGVVGPVGTDIEGERLLSFGTGANASPILPITIPAGSNITTYLHWDQGYASTGGLGAQNSLDFCLTSAPADLVNGPNGPIDEADIIFCTGPSLLNDDPFQIFGGGLGNATDIQAGLVVGVASGATPGRIKITYEGLTVDAPYDTASGTVQGHHNAKGVVAVGASYFRANPVCLPDSFSNFTLEDFSSSGGTPVLFDLTGSRLFTPELRQQPVIVAPDGGRTTFFAFQLGARTTGPAECQNGAADYNFFGTSAAAPHAAGVAALLNEGQPLATPDQVLTAMKTTAIDMAAPGVDFDTGYGFIQADAAMAQLLPAQDLAPTSVAFGNVRVGTTSAASAVTISNPGAFPLAISSITATSGYTADTSACPASLDAGASCVVNVTVRPTATGALAGSLQVLSNAPQSPGTVALSATGVQSFIALSPSSLSFGSVRRARSSAPQTVTVTNTGTAPLNITGFSFSRPGFSQTNTCTAAPIAPQGTCAITVTFTPDGVGAFSSTLSITSDAASTSPRTISLTGSGKGGGAFGLMVLVPGLFAALLRRRKRA